MSSLIWFIIIFFSVLFLIAAFLIVFLIGRHTIKNNPNKAIVLVQNGKEILPYQGKIEGRPSRTGTRYNYLKKTVLVPAEYSEIYLKNKRLLFLNRIGQLIASPFLKEEELSLNEREELIYELVESHIGADGMRALKGKSSINIIVIAIIAFIIGIAATFGFNYIYDTMINQQVNTEQAEQTEQTEPSNLPPVEIRPME